ncbi:hypothetical protein GCM10010129_44150 [Streptomyces fumigatiscleroticus]|nr:hypothetical protein GCM10010129_44150 [Streptomyces fumigatiscleroticus]
MRRADGRTDEERERHATIGFRTAGPLLAGLVAFALAGALLGWAVMYGVMFLKLMIVDMPSYQCGGSDCPRGMMPASLLAAVFGGGFFVLARLGAHSSGKLLPVGGACGAFLCGALAGLWPGWLALAWLVGPHMDVAWEVGPDRPSSARVLGYWESGPATVVRVRTDGLYAYNTAQGDARWSASAPDRARVCALSRTARSGTGLVGLERQGAPCGSSVAAVDLESGRFLWQRDNALAENATGYDITGVASTHATAVVVEKLGTLVGLGLRDGSERWRVDAPPDCGVSALGASGDRVLAVLECSGESSTGETAWLWAVDATSGSSDWRSPLPTSGPVSAAHILSADPIVVYAAGQDPWGTSGVTVFDADGSRRTVIPIAGPDEDLAFTAFTEGPGPQSMPAFQAVVSGELFISVVNDTKSDRPRGVSAYALADGRRVWHTTFDDGIDMLAPGRDGELTVVTSRWFDQLWRLDARSGTREQKAVVLDGVSLSPLFAVRPTANGGYLFVNLHEDSDEAALFAVD